MEQVADAMMQWRTKEWRRSLGGSSDGNNDGNTDQEWKDRQSRIGGSHRSDDRRRVWRMQWWAMGPNACIIIGNFCGNTSMLLCCWRNGNLPMLDKLDKALGQPWIWFHTLRCMQGTCCLLLVVWCLLFVVCCLMFVVYRLLPVASCFLFVVCCLLFFVFTVVVNISNFFFPSF